MEFEYDIIISNSKIDNLGENGRKGWVDNLQYFLEVFLRQLLDREPRIINAANLNSADSLKAFSSSAAFVPIISDDYCDSENCHSDLRKFVNAAEQGLGLYVSETSRIFKIAKSEVSEKKQPSHLQGLFSYEFYDFDESTNEIAHLQIFNSESDRKYWLRLIDLAYDIYKLIDTVSGDNKGQIKSKGSRTIFLAETSSDQRKHRDVIKRELERHGHKVLPEKPLPRDPKLLEDKLIELLSASDMAIHFLGENYGELLEDSTVSIIEQQNIIAANYSERFENSKDSFPRLLWLSPDLKLYNEKQKIFLEDLKQDKQSLIGAEIVQTPLEFLKTIIQNKLVFLDNEDIAKAKNSKASKTKKSIYLVAESKFSADVTKVQSYLESKGYIVLLMDYEQGHQAMISAHRNNLVDCDAALIYYGEDNRQWMKMKLIDLVKAPGFGRKKPMVAKGILSNIMNPTNGIDIKVNELTIIETPGGLNVESVDTLLEKIK